MKSIDWKKTTLLTEKPSLRPPGPREIAKRERLQAEIALLTTSVDESYREALRAKIRNGNRSW